MTIKKVKNIFDTRASRSHDVIYTYKAYRQPKKRANSYLSVAIIALFLAVTFVLISYMAIDYDDGIMYDTKPMINIILTPQKSFD